MQIHANTFICIQIYSYTCMNINSVSNTDKSVLNTDMSVFDTDVPVSNTNYDVLDQY